MTLLKSFAPSSNFNPRSPHGERRGLSGRMQEAEKFQSTLPARGATLTSICLKSPASFQSTLPARGATWGVWVTAYARMISIHAPRTGSDLENY